MEDISCTHLQPWISDDPTSPIPRASIDSVPSSWPSTASLDLEQTTDHTATKHRLNQQQAKVMVCSLFKWAKKSKPAQSIASQHQSDTINDGTPRQSSDDQTLLLRFGARQRPMTLRGARKETARELKILRAAHAERRHAEQESHWTSVLKVYKDKRIENKRIRNSSEKSTGQDKNKKTNEDSHHHLTSYITSTSNSTWTLDKNCGVVSASSRKQSREKVDAEEVASMSHVDPDARNELNSIEETHRDEQLGTHHENLSSESTSTVTCDIHPFRMIHREIAAFLTAASLAMSFHRERREHRADRRRDERQLRANLRRKHAETLGISVGEVQERAVAGRAVRHILRLERPDREGPVGCEGCPRGVSPVKVAEGERWVLE